MTDSLQRLTIALADRYRIERELGQGGMATVYLAEDLRHKRRVALKVLKPELAAVIGADRFVQEITTTASLQHPHILPLFDSGSADGFLYYVMPFIDGETLRAKIDREKQLGVDEAIRIATDVADALHYAHEQGVIHRDIKPENILLHKGRPMVVDFGIALALSAAAGGRLTETGLSLGTPHYMSPEQATAEREISARSDVYSLACVLYEMLTGNPPHTGSSAQQIIMKIVTEHPAPAIQQRRSVPPNVSAAIAKALEKLPADRFATARSFAEALAMPTFSHGLASSTSRQSTAGPDWRARVAVPALLSSLLLLAFVAWRETQPDETVAVARYEVVSPAPLAGDFASVTISPDGSRIAIVGRGADGETRLFVRSRDDLDATELPGTEGGFNPSFSPDGKRLAFMVGPLIRIVDLDGGLPATVVDSAVGVPGLSWGHDGYLYFDARGISPLVRAPITGGKPVAVSTLDSSTKELQHVYPDALPNGRGVIMTINRGGPGQGAYETDAIAVLDLKTGKHRELFRGVYARYAWSGHLLYVTREGELMGVPFDQDKLEVTGEPVALASDIFVSANGTGMVHLSISRNGTLWYGIGASGGALRDVMWVTRDGRFTPLEPALRGNFADIALSPDGNRIAYVLRAVDGSHVWVSQLGSRNRTRLTFDRAFIAAAWSPDGASVLVTRTPGDLLTVRADGGAQPIEVGGAPPSSRDAQWMPDGSGILFSAQGERSNDIFAVSLDSSHRVDTLVSTPDGEVFPTMSPDKRWLLYQLNRGVTSEIFVRPFPGTSRAIYQVSTGGGTQPKWSLDGREIFYRSRLDSLVAAPVMPGGTFALGEARALFSLRGMMMWDVAPDGRRFIVVRAETSAKERLVVVENFHEELKMRMKR